MRRGTEPAGGRRGKGAALAVGAGIMLSRLSGLVRERVFAHYLGNSEAAGAFRAALRIPNLLQNLFGEGALSASLIPVYARLLAEGRTADAAKVASTVLTALVALTGVLALAGAAAADPLVTLLTPGFAGATRELTVELVRIMFPGIGLLVLSAWCLGVLNSHRRFFLSYVAPVIWNAAIIAVLAGTAGWMAAGDADTGRLARGAAWGVTLGALLQLAVQLPGALRLNGGRLAAAAFGDDGVRSVARNFVPAFLARGVVQISAYVDEVLLSFLGAGIMAASAYAQTLVMLPASLFGLAVSAAELPEMASAAGDRATVAAALRTRLEGAVGRLLFFVIPSAAALTLGGQAVVTTLFRTGRFGAADVTTVWTILAGMALSLPWSTRARLYSSAFWALQNTRTPALIATVRVTAAALVGWLAVMPLKTWLNYDAVTAAALLAGGSGLCAVGEFYFLRAALRRRIGAFRTVPAHVGRVILAALLAGAAAGASALALAERPPLVAGLLPLGIFCVVYGGICWVLRVPESIAALATVKRRLGASRR